MTVDDDTHSSSAATLGPWRLVRKLGIGGMGTVWRAERADGAFRMKVAVKLINRDAVGPDQIERFVRERQILADLDHPNICRLIDGGTAPDGRPYLVMELVEGQPLDRYFEPGSAAQRPRIVGAFVKLCDALSLAHGRAIIHRDLKPSNIMVTASGEPKLLDFGIARSRGASEPTLTRTGELALTPCYASPEQWRREEVGPASDVFSLGVILYELLVGELPPMPGLRAVSEGPLVEARVDPPLRSVVMRAVHDEPERRFPSMAALGDALREQDGARVVGRVLDRAEPEPVPPLELPGGIVSPDSPYYVALPRLELACREELAKRGALVRIKGSRQMGKTSLMMRLLSHAAGAGARTVVIDLRLTDNAILDDLDRFLRWLCAVVSRRLRLPTRTLDDEWDDLFGAKDNCTAYFEDHLLRGDGPLVLALDNVDRVFEHPAVAEELLSLLRAWNEMGKSQAPWDALRLVLVYATEMYLPMSTNHSPFNVGLPVALTEWDASTVRELAGRHGLRLGEAELERLLEVLGGHPHLTRVALHHLAAGATLDDVLSRAATDDGLLADHLKSLLWHLQTSPELSEAAARVVASDEPVRLRTELAFKLASLGLVQLTGNEVRVTRELYRRYLGERL